MPSIRTSLAVMVHMALLALVPSKVTFSSLYARIDIGLLILTLTSRLLPLATV